MDIIFLLGAQVIVQFLRRFVKHKARIHHFSMVLSLVVIAIWSDLYGLDAFTEFNLWLLLFSVVFAYGLYFVSLVIVGTKLKKENLIPIGCFNLLPKLSECFAGESYSNIYHASYEELLYRWFLQTILYELTGSAVLSIAITALLFFAVHLDGKIAIVQMIDIFVFSVAITVFYYYTVNPIYCIVIHILRNQLVISQKYVAKQKEQDKTLRYMRLLKDRYCR